MPLRPPAGYIRPGYDPLEVPDAPTIGTATSVSGTSASVTFTAPTNVGGGAITGYIATARRTSDGTSVGVVGSSSPITITGLVTGAAYTVTVVAVNSFGPSASSAASNSVTMPITGQQQFTTFGTYSWVAPAGVTSVSVVSIGAGGAGANVVAPTYSCGGGGGGGELKYVNNISVTPGSSYTVVVGRAYQNAVTGAGANGTAGGSSSFNSTSVIANGGQGGLTFANGGAGGAGGSGGTGAGGNGGAGGDCTRTGYGAGGGGAGGYSGNGGAGGTNAAGSSGLGGGAGGGGGPSAAGSGYAGVDGAPGGGVALSGEGASGAGGAEGAANTNNAQGGFGGSGGSNASTTTAGLYGGGGQGTSSNSNPSGGAVRIIWPGTTRSFPSTNTGDL